MRITLAAENTKHLQGIGLLRLLRNNLAVECFGLLQLPGAVGLRSLCE
jgi:hypothetical protein